MAGYLSDVVAGAPVEAIVDFYLAAKAEAVRQGGWEWRLGVAAAQRTCRRCVHLCHDTALLSLRAIKGMHAVPLPQEATLQDGAGHKPAYNLRSLCRALEYAARATPTYGLQASLAASRLGWVAYGLLACLLLVTNHHEASLALACCPAALPVGRFCHVLPHPA